MTSSFVRVRRCLGLSLVLPLVALGCSGSGGVKGGPFTGDPANFTYQLDGTEVTLKAGTFEQKTGDKPDDVVATDLTGARLDADFDGDDSTDCAVVLTRDTGPLKTHYLAVIPGGSSSARTLALGKNVLVEKLDLDPKGGVIVSMLIHAKGAPEEDAPTVSVRKSFALKGGDLVETGTTSPPAEDLPPEAGTPATTGEPGTAPVPTPGE